ncbi:MAG: exodeoxyribonuclease VII small subunit [Candidatus Andersenbacteria bacterium]
MPIKKKEAFDFTKGYKELETIVTDFESRELDLEKDLPKFERGLELAAQLQKRLKEIDNKVVEIEKKFSSSDDV